MRSSLSSFEVFASERGQGMACARITQDAPPRLVCEPWTGAPDGLRGRRAHGRQPAASRLVCTNTPDLTPSQHSATLARDTRCSGDAAEVTHTAGRTDARLQARAVRLRVLTPRSTLAAQRPRVPAFWTGPAFSIAGIRGETFRRAFL